MTTSIERNSMRLSILLLSLVALQPLRAQSYTVTHSYRVGGEGSWDYVVPDAPNHRVFIGRSNRVMVVDMNDGHLIAEVTGINGAHGTALAAGTRHGFATSGNDSSVVMFDSKTYRTLGRIRAAEDADAIIYDPASKRVFTFNGDANSSTVIDPRKGTFITNIPLGGKPEEGESARDGMIYANLTDSSQIVEIDAKRLRVTRRWSTAPCKNPVSIAIDRRNKRLFSGCRSGVMAISDYRNGRVITTVPIGRGVDGAGYDPVKRDAFASNVDGTLTVIHQDTPDTYHVVENVQTGDAARNMGLDRASHRIYIPSAKFGPVPAESTATNPRRRPPMLPGTFMVLVVEPVGSH
ncbi:MAG: YncE family protein [Gemmatimonadota bacterium]|nr:YncE family protein [Gemmatimonadota bacterium]